MIGWIHQRGKDWGRWQRRQVSGWPSTSLMARIRDEGSVGAAIKQHFARLPIQPMPGEIAEFHRAYLAMHETHRRVVEVMYLTRAGRGEKADALGLSISQMYRVLDQAHGFFAGRLGEKSHPSHAAQAGYGK